MSSIEEIKTKEQERAILIGVQLPLIASHQVEESLGELKQLAATAGAEVVSQVIQIRNSPHSRTYIGPGKAEEIAELSRKLGAELVICDCELSPSQQHNLEKIISRKIIDRTALILDIFAQHAHSREGKLQVELAQLVYYLPRIRGRGVELSRLGGGIGTRGPGEQKLEVDRRRIRKRIQRLKFELDHVKQNRMVQRKKRKREAVFSVSIVGYTNAGKSTLLNTLTDAHVLVQDQLFATLDSTTRKLDLPSNQKVVISDTVGFIRRLPYQLIASFRSTLDEVRDADLVLHLINAGHPQMVEQMEAVNIVLGEIDAADKPRLEVFNKTDTVSDDELERLKKRYPDAVFISALQTQGMEDLMDRIDTIIGSSMVRVELKISFREGGMLEKIYAIGQVLSEKHSPDGTEIIARIPKQNVGEIESFLAKNKQD